MDPLWFVDNDWNVYCALHAIAAGITQKRPLSEILAHERWRDRPKSFYCHGCDRRYS